MEEVVGFCVMKKKKMILSGVGLLVTLLNTFASASDLLVAEAAHTSRGFGFAVSHICGKAAGFVV